VAEINRKALTVESHNTITSDSPTSKLPEAEDTKAASGSIFLHLLLEQLNKRNLTSLQYPGLQNFFIALVPKMISRPDI